jgi:predicted nucleotidyltransferase
MDIAIPVDRARIAEFCQKWGIVELSIFGSAVRGGFRPDSDVDVLVSFAPGAGITFDNRVAMQDELCAILGREVDLVEKSNLRNPFRRHSILTTRQLVYAA